MLNIAKTDPQAGPMVSQIQTFSGFGTSQSGEAQTMAQAEFNRWRQENSELPIHHMTTNMGSTLWDGEPWTEYTITILVGVPFDLLMTGKDAA